MSFFTTATIGFSLLMTLASCKIKSQTNKQGYVLGDSNDIEIYKESSSKSATKTVSSVALIVTTMNSGKKKFCTGSLIKHEGQIGIITNFHCFANASEDGKVESFFFTEACTTTKIYFEFTKADHDKAVGHACKVGTLVGDHDGDLAFFELEDEESILTKRQALKFSEEENVDGVEAEIFHHPDIPENYVSVGDEGISMPAMAVTRKNCKVNHRYATKEWPLDPTLPFSIKHTCDLIHGSSGSPLLSTASGKILGINWGGIEIEYKKGIDTSNAATSADYVTAFLEGKTAQVRRHAEDVTAMEIKNQSKKEKAGLLTGAKSCATIAIRQHSTALLFLLFPIFVLIRRRRVSI